MSRPSILQKRPPSAVCRTLHCVLLLSSPLLAAQTQEATPENRAVYDNFTAQLEQAKAQKKPLLLFLLNESSSISKKLDVQVLNRSAIGEIYDKYVPARIQLGSEIGTRISKTYRISRSPHLAVLNSEGEYVDGLDLSSIGESLITPALALQISQWLEKNSRSFSSYGGLGYAQKALGKDDPIQPVLQKWKAQKDQYKGADKVLLLDHGTMKVSEDGTLVKRLHTITALGEDLMKRAEIESFLTNKNSTLKILRVRTITPDGKQNILEPGSIQESPVYSDFPSWEPLKVSRYSFPGAQAGCITELEFELTETPQLKGHFSCDWRIESEHVPSLDSQFTLELPAKLEVQHSVHNHSVRIKVEKVSNQVTRLSWKGASEQFLPNPRKNQSAPKSSYLTIAGKNSWEAIGAWFLEKADTGHAHSPEMDAWIDSILKPIAPGERYEKRVTNAFMEAIGDTFRYLSINMDNSGYQPHPVADTFAHKYGDCKDLSLFLRECLQRAHIESDLVILKTDYFGDSKAELPRVPFFTHCILKVQSAESPFYVDPVAFGMSAGNLPADDHSCPALLCSKHGIQFFTTPAYHETSAIQIEASFSDLDTQKVKVDLSETFSGPPKDYNRRNMRGISQQDLKQLPQELVGKVFTNFTAKNAEASGHEPGANQFKLSFSGTIKQPFAAGGQLLLLPVLLDNGRFLRGLPTYLSEGDEKGRGLHTGWKLAPMTQKLTYKIPQGMDVKETPAPVHLETPHFKVDLDIEHKDDTLTCKSSILIKFVPGEVRKINESEMPEIARLVEDKLKGQVILRKRSQQILFEASEKGDLALVRELAEDGADLEAKNPKGSTALLLAATAGRLEVVKYLLSKGCNIDAVNPKNECALFLACNNGKADVAEHLIQSGAATDLVTNRGYIPLMAASGFKNQLHIVKGLLEKGSNINAISDEGTPLFYAVHGNCLETAKVLLEAGADMYLLSKEKDYGNTFNNPHLGFCATKSGYIPMMETLLSHGFDINRPARQGTTALHLAVGWDQEKNVEFLLKAGAGIDLLTNDGESAVYFASRYGKPKLLKQLLQWKPNLNLQDTAGKTALIAASSEADIDNKTRIDLVKQLIEAGCDPNVEDFQHQTAYTRAGNAGKVEVLAYLAEHGATLRPLRIIPFEHRPDPLTAARQWCLSIGAPYFMRNNLDSQYLGGAKKPVPKWNKDILVDSWDIKNKTDLLNQLEHLRDAGHHLTYQQQSKRFAQLDEQGFEQFVLGPTVNPAEREKLRAIRNGYLKWGDRNALAWDWCRFVWVTNLAFGAGFITEEEAFKQLLPVAVLVQKSFHSWLELSENFSDARVIWNSERDPELEALLGLLRNKEDPNSPWTRLAWDVDLSK